MKHFFTKAFFTGFMSVCLLLVAVQPSFPEECATGKTLILYYSLTGNTRAGCEALQRELDATIVEIRDLRKRSGKWGFFKTAIGSLFGRHTKIEPETPDFTGYDNIILF